MNWFPKKLLAFVFLAKTITVLQITVEENKAITPLPNYQYVKSLQVDCNTKNEFLHN